MSQTTKSKLSCQPVEEEANLTSQTKDPVSSARQQRASCLASQLKRKLISQARLRRTQCLEPDNKEQAVSPAS